MTEGTRTATAEARVAELAAAQAGPLGLAVLGVEVVAGREPAVRVTVDVDVPDHGRLEPGGAPAGGVDVEAIAVLARTLDAALVADGAVTADAVVEVASPGVDRPLVDARDFVRNLGREVEVELADGGRALGRVVAVGDGHGELAPAGRGRTGAGYMSVALDAVVRALPVLPW
ncbi:MAG: ribosome maturation factor RimP [Nitriliruptoraceae bacterium]